MKKCIGILFGGQSSEHPVSLMSTVSVLRNLPEKYETYLVGITKDGKWYHYQGKIENIEDGSWEKDVGNREVILSPNANHHGFYELVNHKIVPIDCLFPVLHGRFGEDGSIQGLCQLNGIPCVSDNMTACAISMDKEFTHIVAERAGIEMAKYLVFHRNHHSSFDEMYKQSEDKFGMPCYVKPSKEGSSFGAHKVHNRKEFEEYCLDAFSYDEKIIVEEFIEGNEVGCAVLGDLVVGVVDEVVVETEMYGYAEKYDGFKTVIYTPTKNLTEKQQKQVIEMGKVIYQAIGCDVMARIDFFASEKRIVFNELNLIPGFTSHSRYPAMFRESGVSYSELLERLIELVCKEK